uniref:Uncharacterized protein n=1 Tax=Helicotheca tamesis TaxID=374047 RepID=A0A7S2HI97_9STRA|mmetsp:Transcript_18296/g.25184  ORF Transcript_18296/g.25184 Transcript_18296/m.25184 type:complete len:195 (+) Transcript_18296:98-682(+)
MLVPPLQEHLVTQDGIVYQVFVSSKECFLDLVVVQVLDVLYSQILSSAWGNGNSRGGIIASSKDVFDEMVALRDALAKIMSMVETVCRLLLHKFQCQRWRKVPQTKVIVAVTFFLFLLWVLKYIAPFWSLERTFRLETLCGCVHSKMSSLGVRFELFGPFLPSLESVDQTLQLLHHNHFNRKLFKVCSTLKLVL